MDYPKSVPSVGLVNGKFVDENPITGQIGSLISSEWGNAVTDELLNVIRAGGKVPAEAEHDQLLAAIKAIVRDSIPPEKIRSTLAEYGITDAYTKSVTYTKAEIEALLKNMSALPVGAMVPFPKGTVPAGFLEVDGSVQSAATYPDLAAYLGTAFNTGNEGAGNFRLPESRGEFLRGWDHGRGVDVGRVLGSRQAATIVSAGDGTKTSAAVVSLYNSADDSLEGNKSRLNSDGTPPLPITGVSDIYTGTTGSDVTAYSAMYVRPRNLAVMWCIKAWNAPVNQGNIDVAALAAQLGPASSTKSGVTRYASAAEAQAMSVVDAACTPRSLNKLLPAAWVNFNGTGTVVIRDAHNVASITDFGVGFYGINFTNPLNNTNYAVVGSVGNFDPVESHSTLSPRSYSTSSLTIKTPGPVNGYIGGFYTADCTHINVAIFGGVA